MEELFDTEGIDIDMSEQLPEESTEEVPEVEDNNSDQVPESIPDPVQNEVTEEQIEEVPDDSEKVEKALRKILEDISDEEEDKEEKELTDGTEELNEEVSEENSESDIKTSEVSDVEPLLNDILKEIKESDTSKDVTGMYQTITSVTDSNNLGGKLNEQSATNVILMAILTVLMVDIAIHFCKGVL